MNHPHFTLPMEIAKAIKLGSFRRGERGLEASRRRGTMEWTVIGDEESVAELIPRIEAVRARAHEPALREMCDRAIATIRLAITVAAAPTPVANPTAPSHREQGYLGTAPSQPAEGQGAGDTRYVEAKD
jgi:hypothetical protein